MPKLGLDRQQLASFLPNAEAIRAFERMFEMVDGAPANLDEATALAASATAVANSAMALLVEYAGLLEQLRAAPAPVFPDPADDLAPPVIVPSYADDFAPVTYVGGLGLQSSDDVNITGGSIDGTTIGASSASTGAFTTLSASGAVALSPANANVVMSPTGTGLVTINPATLGTMNKVAIGGTTPSSGAFTTVSATGQITSTLASGTAPFVVASVTKVSNLNADLLDGTDWAAPGTIGGTTPASASFTTITASGLLNISAAGAGQIKFPATQNPSADANTLDDYEEGTWTATVVTTGTQPSTPVTGTCYYTKVGRLVTLHLVLSNFTIAGATGDIYISGMPFACASAPAAGAVWSWNAGATAAVARADVGSSDVGLFQMTANTRIAVTNGAGQYLYATVTYIA